MRDARVYEDKYMWLQVTKALTQAREERDEAWIKLQKVAPQQARWLQDSLLPHQWQQSEMLHHGRPTQAFNCSTNNVAESTGYLLLVRPVGELAVRNRGPADAICGFYVRFFANKVLRKENWCQESGLQSILKGSTTTCYRTRRGHALYSFHQRR
jgi:hypothetical protein